MKKGACVCLAAVCGGGWQDYFPGSACVHIEGRTFPVTEHYLDDYLAQTGYFVSPTGKVLQP